MAHARAFITGGSGGIGSACIRELEARGSRVCAPSHLECDVRFPGDLASAMSTGARELGGLDAVIACAGVRIAPTAATADTETEHVIATIDVNACGAYFTAREAIRYLVPTHGHLILISSIAALVPAPRGASYAMSKAAVRALGSSLSKEYREEMKVTTMILGATDTPMWQATDLYPRGKMLRPEDVARAIADVLETPWGVSVDEMMFLPRDGSVRPPGW